MRHFDWYLEKKNAEKNLDTRVQICEILEKIITFLKTGLSVICAKF